MSLAPQIDRPVFMIGTGRSGTTLAYRLLVRHPELSWFSSYDLRFPDSGVSHWAKAIFKVPGLDKRAYNTQRGMYARPVEPFALLDQAFPGFSEPYRSLRASDVTPWAAKRLRELVAARQRQEARPRFTMKWTGWSRAGFMNEVFPDARFIHVHRDGRAVANSLLQQPWWKGWGGPDKWRWGPLSPVDQQTWDDSEQSFLVLAGLQWKLCFCEIEASLAQLPAERVHRLSFEDLCQDPIGRMREVMAFAQLPWSSDVEARIAATQIRPAAVDRWKRDVTPEQANLLQEALAPQLKQQQSLR